MDNQCSALQEIIDTYDGIVFFGGAGVSTASGIPDFRSSRGIQSQAADLPFETILSRTYYEEHRTEFFAFHRKNIVHLDAQPNAAHFFLAELERTRKLRAVITQNIDGLHQKAGSRNVLELHGSVERNICEDCDRVYGAEKAHEEPYPRCSCGGLVHPDVVLYEDSLDEDVLNAAVTQIMEAKVLIIGGTSMVVYPAAGLIRYFQGEKLVVVNKTPVKVYKDFDLVVQGDIAEIFGQLHIN